MTTLHGLCAAALSLSMISAALAGPPSYTAVRSDEDYRYVKDAAQRSDVFDPIKYMTFNEEGDWYLSLGGQARYRYEFFNNAAFGGGPAGGQDESGYHLLRLMGHVDLHLGEHLRTFVQVRSSEIGGREGGPRPVVDEDEFDFEQAFADVMVPLGEGDAAGGQLTLRGGRQNLLYGAQRLISPLDWTNTRRTFDGGKGSLKLAGHTLDVFAVSVVEVDDSSINRHDDDQFFTGVYDVIALPQLLPGDGAKVDVYALYLDRDGAVFGPGVADEDRYTVGTRFFAAPKPWDFDLELTYQFGEFGDAEISAWSAAAEAGYRLSEAGLRPRVALGFDAASGDRNPADGDLNTFNQLYPLGHAYFGFIDAIGRQNIIDLHPSLTLDLAKGVTFRADYHLFWRQSDDDAAYNAGGGILRADGGSDERFIGSEIDLLLTWQVDRHLQLSAGYSHLFAGSFIEDTGPSEDIDFVYTAVQYTF